MLEENRAEVLAVAHALETHRTVTGDDIAAVIQGTVGPTVDGRTYQDPGFRQMLENYHQAALRAHKQHGSLDTVIPVPIPPPPVEVAASAPTATPHVVPHVVPPVTPTGEPSVGPADREPPTVG